MPPPKVFISHATEDKERFVLQFAERLRKNGVDAWVDLWEMLPGDSLVDKIFEEGLREAAAIIVVLSNASVTKPWVREELNSALVSRVERGARLIPVVLDDCEVPQALRSTVWERVDDLENYDESIDRILDALFRRSNAPDVGTPPQYAVESIEHIVDLDRVDTLVLRASCESLEDHRDPITPELVFGPKSELGLRKEQVIESIEVLENRGYVDVSRYMGGAKERWGCHYRITTFGFEAYLDAYEPKYSEYQHQVISAIVNEQKALNLDIADHTNVPLKIVDHLIDRLAEDGYVKLSKSMGHRTQIFHVSPELKRSLQ